MTRSASAASRGAAGERAAASRRPAARRSASRRGRTPRREDRGGAPPPAGRATCRPSPTSSRRRGEVVRGGGPAPRGCGARARRAPGVPGAGSGPRASTSAARGARRPRRRRPSRPRSACRRPGLAPRARAPAGAPPRPARPARSPRGGAAGRGFRPPGRARPEDRLGRCRRSPPRSCRGTRATCSRARCARSPASERVETWVVDNASADGSAEMVRAEFPAVRLVASEENLGFGRAVNLVAERSASPWLLIANADAAARPGALDALLAAADRDPGAGALGAPPLPAGRQHPALGLGLPHGALHAPLQPGRAGDQRPAGRSRPPGGRVGPRPSPPRALGGRGLPADTPGGMVGGGRLRPPPVDVRRGPGPRLAASGRRVGHPLRPRGRGRSPQRRLPWSRRGATR